MTKEKPTPETKEAEKAALFNALGDYLDKYTTDADKIEVIKEIAADWGTNDILFLVFEPLLESMEESMEESICEYPADKDLKSAHRKIMQIDNIITNHFKRVDAFGNIVKS